MNQLRQYLDTISRFKPELEEKYLVNSIGLFGSVVRDDFSASKSDLDIIVDFKRPIGIEFIELAYYLEEILKRKVDLVSRKGVRPHYFKAIESEIVYV